MSILKVDIKYKPCEEIFLEEDQSNMVDFYSKV